MDKIAFKIEDACKGVSRSSKDAHIERSHPRKEIGTALIEEMMLKPRK